MHIVIVFTSNIRSFVKIYQLVEKLRARGYFDDDFYY